MEVPMNARTATNLSDSCHDIAEILAGVAPLSRSASPATVEQYEELERSVLLIVPHIRRLFGQDVLDPARRDPSSPPPSPVSDDQERPVESAQAKKIRKRVNFALEGLWDDGPLEPEESLLVITRKPFGPRAKYKDTGLRFLIRGYPLLAHPWWKEILHPFAHNLPAIKHLQQSIAKYDSIRDLQSRLFQRHQNLGMVAAAHAGDSWVVHVIMQVSALKFALDWKGIAGPGSLATKTRFYQTVFAAQMASEIPGGVGDHVQYVASHMDREYKAWMRAHIEPLVLGRNRLLHLYNTLGAGVVMDPLWDIQGLGLRASKEFVAVVEKLSASLPEYDDMTSSAFVRRLHDNAQHALSSMLHVLAGPEVHSYVFDFFQDNVPTRTRS